ncbi:MAG: hypothetical protein Faunusvirus6_30 [Faunusvirus sp.]|jgi:ankyrin repeat protein|uniref:Uncharacterized protein n=1 Tax=Faunusvirus sp. TaxID=2487766 RepID=A0A3G4ZWG3_9VIRU|nr:MAG: hypothetical protein Faunusvirus6_30 [Faunusvirus sp.]
MFIICAVIYSYNKMDTHLYSSEVVYFATEFRDSCLYANSERCIDLLNDTQHKYINVKLLHNETPILAALWYNLPDVAQILYDHGCDLTAIDQYGYNVLMSASRYNHEFIKILLENHKNIDINAKNCDNMSALAIAIYYDNLESAILLANYGADTDCQPYAGRINTYIQFRKIMHDSYKKLIIEEIDDPQSIIYRSFQTTYAIGLVDIICDFII